MPTIPCFYTDRSCECEGNGEDSPTLNLSAEQPDPRRYPGPIFPDWTGEPPLGGPWVSRGCLFPVWSIVSQEEADDLAQMQQALCIPPPPPVCDPSVAVCDQPACPGCPPTNPPDDGPHYYYSTQTCDVPCGADTVSATASYVSTISQADADTRAMSIACSRASCRGALAFVTSRLPWACTDISDVGEYSFQFRATGAPPGSTYTYVWTSGEIPPGMTFTNGLLTGFPTTGGLYTFNVKATASTGQTIESTFTLRVFEFLTLATLPDATLNDLYQPPNGLDFTFAGAVHPELGVVDGALPPGMTLGAIPPLYAYSVALRGTPTVAGTYDFIIQAQDRELPTDEFSACEKAFTLVVAETYHWMSRAPDCNSYFAGPYTHPDVGTKLATASAVSTVGAAKHVSLSSNFVDCFDMPIPGDLTHLYTKESVEFPRLIDGGPTGQKVDVVIDVVWQMHPLYGLVPHEWNTAPYGNVWCYTFGGVNHLNELPGTAVWTAGSAHYTFTFNVAPGASDLFIAQLTSSRSLPTVWDMTITVTPI